jgi:alpha 1,4-glycosyltransferase
MASFSTFFHGQMTGLEITCLHSFLDHGHEVDVYAYGDCGAPGHFKVLDASLIIPADRLFFYKAGFGAGSPAGFANYFRYRLLEQLDTIWIDSDVVCLSSEWPTQSSRLLAAWEDSDHVNNAVLQLPRHAASLCRAEAERLGEDIGWGQSGPFLLTRLLKELNLTSHVFPSAVFYPVHYREWYKPVMPDFTSEVTDRCKNSLAIHLWHSMMKYSNFDNSLQPDDESFFGQLVVKHGSSGYFKVCSKQEYRALLAACHQIRLPD